MKSALIIGADGAIGSALFERLKQQGIDAHATGRQAHIPLDLAMPETWPELPKTDVAYICAAVSKLDACEHNPAVARQINIDGTTKLAQKLRDAGSFVVFLSSNQVFDGSAPFRKASDAPSPINEYGRQKAEAERAVLALGNSAVLRLTKVVVPGDSRIAAWHEALRDEKSVTAFDDIFLAPITLENVLDALIDLGNRKKVGLFQISGEKDFSYYELACAIAKHVGKNETLVERGSGAEKGVPANFRPRYSSYAPGDFPNVRVPGMGGIIEYALKT